MPASSRAVDATITKLRAAFIAARERSGLTRIAMSRRCRCAPSTLLNIEEGRHCGRIDTYVSYAHSVGLDIAAVPAHLAHLLDLDHDDVVAVLRAAQTAAEGHRLNPLQSRRVAEVLAKLRTPLDPVDP